ncbi:MAG: efflux RND transporter permease subunit [Burkholderiaceae bacterium]
MKDTDEAAPARQPFNLSRWAIEHSALTRYLLIVLSVLGFVSYFQLAQNEDPPFTFRAMVVRAYWPGASAQQMADLVSDKIEKTLQQVPYSDRIQTYTKPGQSFTIFQIKDSSPPRAVKDVWYTVRKKIADAAGDLPAGVIGPFFDDDFGDVYGSMYSLTGSAFSAPELKRAADQVRDQLLRVADVAKVALYGVQDERVFVEADPRRLAQFGISLQEVVAQLGAQNAITPAGVIDSVAARVRLTVTGDLKSIDDLRQFPIRVVNRDTGAISQTRLADLAQVRRGLIDPPSVMVRDQGREAIVLGISMAEGGDILALGKALDQATARIRADLPLGMSLEQVQDQPKVVAASVNEFVKVLIEAVLIVLAVSFVSLGLQFKPLRLDLRPGLTVGVTIPVVLALTFLTMYYWGIGLHKISLGSLIIALGLLVDDAIIAVEMMVRKLEEGYDRLSAASFAYRATAMPMLTGTLITAVGFLPIGMARSTVGEYTFAIFAVTATALLISWVASVYFVPYLGARFLNAPEPGSIPDDHNVFDTPMYRGFRRLVDFCVDHRWLTILATVATLGLGVFGMGKVQQQFFPDSTRPEVLVELWLPEGASIAASDTLARRFEARMMAEPGVQRVSAWIGSGVPRFYLPLPVLFPQTNLSQFIVLTESLGERKRLMDKLPTVLAQEFSEARGRAKLMASGPPVPYPVQFRVIGPDPKVLRRLADQLLGRMREHPSLLGVNDNWNESLKSVRLVVDQAKARALGVTSQSIAQALAMQFSGAPIGQFREGDQLIDIVLIESGRTQDAQDRLNSAYVVSSTGRALPLSQIARAELLFEPGVMWRESRQYAITVQGDTVEGVQGATVSRALEPGFERLARDWPIGYRIETAGAAAESAKGQDSIFLGMPVMLFIIFTLLMIQLQSFSRAMLVFLTGPMGIAGVAAALILMGRPFGFVAMLGVIALMGMIMRNSVILIDQIEQDRRSGIATWQAIVGSTVRRARPIVLTAAAAVLAMIPLTRSVFWGPMAVAIMGGLIIATVLTLLALPAMYAAWFRVRRDTR